MTDNPSFVYILRVDSGSSLFPIAAARQWPRVILPTNGGLSNYAIVVASKASGAS